MRPCPIPLSSSVRECLLAASSGDRDDIRSIRLLFRFNERNELGFFSELDLDLGNFNL